MASAIDVPQKKMSYVEKYLACKEKFREVLLQFVINACEKLIAANKPGEAQKLYETVFINWNFIGKHWFPDKKSDDGTNSRYCTTEDILYGPLMSDATSDGDRDFKAWGNDALFFEIQREIYDKYGFILLDHSDFDHKGFCMRVYSRPPAKGIMPMQPHKHDIIPRNILESVQVKYERVSEAAPSTPVRSRPVREVPGAPSKPAFEHVEAAVAAPAPAPQAMAPMMPLPAMGMMMPPPAMAQMMPGMGFVQTAYGPMRTDHAAALAYGMHAMGLLPQYPPQQYQLPQ